MQTRWVLARCLLTALAEGQVAQLVLQVILGDLDTMSFVQVPDESTNLQLLALFAGDHLQCLYGAADSK